MTRRVLGFAKGMLSRIRPSVGGSNRAGLARGVVPANLSGERRVVGLAGDSVSNGNEKDSANLLRSSNKAYANEGIKLSNVATGGIEPSSQQNSDASEILHKRVAAEISQMKVDMPKESVVVFGFGNMARAISAGLDVEIEAVVGDESKPRDHQEGVSYISKHNPKYSDFLKCQRRGDVILSVKPSELKNISQDLQSLEVNPQNMVVSVLAGVSTNVLRQIFPTANILRTMPNTPLAEGFGVTGIYLPKEMSHKRQDAMKYFGNQNNQVVFVEDERKINDITGISGSGPAYFFMAAEEIVKANAASDSDFKPREKKVFDIMRTCFDGVDIASYEPKFSWSGNMQEMAESASADAEKVRDFILSMTQALYKKGLALGFSKEDSQKLAVGTAIGAGQYGFKSKDDAKTLREKVTSPKGTTAEALEVFRNKRSNLGELVASAVQAASDRAEVLGTRVENDFLQKKTTSSGPVLMTANLQLAKEPDKSREK